MAKLFLGNREVTPAIFSDGANRYSPSRTVINGTLTQTPDCKYLDLTGVEIIDNYALGYAYYNIQSNENQLPDFSNIKEVRTYGMYYAFYYNKNATGTLDFSSLDTISGGYAFYDTFYQCNKITGILDMSALKQINSSYCFSSAFNSTAIEEVRFDSLEFVGSSSNQCFSSAFSNNNSLISANFGKLKECRSNNVFQSAFYNCQNFEDIDISSLVSVRVGITTYSINIFSSMFYNCKKLTSVDFGSLTYLCGNGAFNNTFSSCTSLTSVDFSNLSVILAPNVFNYAFQNCTSLTTLSFPKLLDMAGMQQNIFSNMLKGCSNVTVHFPSNLQTTMSSWADVTAGFGGTNTTVLWDLPASTSVIDYTTVTELKYDYQYSNEFYNITLNVDKIDFSELKTITGNYSLYYMFAYSSGSPEVDFSNLESINGNYTFSSMLYSCAGFPELDFSGLKTINGDYSFNQIFYNCTGSPKVDLSGLKTINGNYSLQQAFYNCSGSPELDFSGLEIVNGNYTLQTLYTNVSANGNPKIKFDSLKRINGHYIAYRMYYNAKELTNINLQNLTTIGGYQSAYEMFRNCPKLESVDLRKLSVFGTNDTAANHNIVFGYAFADCPNLTSVNLDSLENFTYWYFTNNSNTSLSSYTFNNSGIINNPLTSVSAGKSFPYCFYSCKSLEDGTFKRLTYIIDTANSSLNYCFGGCDKMDKCDFPALMKTQHSQVFYDTFYNCTSSNFTDVNFPMLINLNGKNPFANPYSFRTNGTNRLTVHFRKDMQSTISALSSYSSGWGAGSIVFDLVGTITVNGDNYLRIGYCNKPGYVAWVKSTSNIVINGNTYTYTQNDVGCFSQRSITNPDVLHGVAFCWNDSINNVTVNSHKIELENGDLVYSSTSTPDPDLEITTANVEIVYTADSAEPDVGDSVYSDLGTTVIGTISAIA